MITDFVSFDNTFFQAVHLGPIKWVFLYELDLVKEAYKRDEINYRARTEFVHKVQILNK